MQSKRFRFRSLRRSASILVLALWVLAFLGLFSISIGYSVRQKLTLANRLDTRNTLKGIAEAGVFKSLQLFVRAPGETGNGYHYLGEEWANSELKFKEYPSGPGSYTISYPFYNRATQQVEERYGLRDEESKLNLNKVKAVVLSRLIQHVTDLEEDEANEIAYSVVDWRDTDILLSHPNYGAEDDYYEDLKPPYTVKNAKFDVLDELLLVRGMNREIFDQIKNYVTVFGGGAVNINTAQEPVLSALRLSSSLVTKILIYRAGADGLDGTMDDRLFYSPSSITSTLSQAVGLSSGEVASLNNTVNKGIFVTESGHFHVHSLAELPNGLQMALEAVFEIDKGTIEYWHIGVPKRKNADALAS